MLLSTAIERYVLDLEERMLSEAHIETVTYRLERFRDWLGDTELDGIARLDLAHYFRHEENRGLAEGSLAGFRSTHNAFWRWCDGRGWCDGNLASRIKRYSSRPVHRKKAPEEDVATVVEELPAYVARRDGQPVDVRDALLASLSIDSGARLGALCNLTNDAMQEALADPRRTKAGHVAYLATSTGKTGRCNVIFFSASAGLYRQWRELQSRRAEYVFTSVYTGKQLQRQTVSTCLAKVCRWCGARPLRPQAIRKANVTGVIKQSNLGVGQRYAEHSKMETTRAFYYEITRDDVLDTAAELSAKRRGNLYDDELAKLFGITR